MWFVYVKITSLETELLEVQKSKADMSGEEQASSGTQEMQEVRGFPWENVLFRNILNEHLL